MDFDKDWKKKVGFPINYNSGQSSDDDFVDVVLRPRKSEILLADEGDGAEADQLGTTPPRERIRVKQKRKTYLESTTVRDGVGRRTLDDLALTQPMSPATERLKKRLSVKMMRSKERDWKQDLGLRDAKADSLPSSNPEPAVPTLVESCSRFMSLKSRLKCREALQPADTSDECIDFGDELPPSRVNFHNTFSLLINMGNVDKGCRRTISREEQVWQNELKDLIWLELQAKLAGRTLAQQDAFLCQQRLVVPTVIHNIRNYCFVNPNPCRARLQKPRVIDGSREDLTEHSDEGHETDGKADENHGVMLDCLSFNCQLCSDAIGKALREVGTLLESLYNAATLYPSTKAMTSQYPLVATLLFQNRVKAMCLWYNTAMHMRLKVVGLRRMMRALKLKGRRRGFSHLASTDSDVSRQSTEKPCQVRFNVSNTPSDSNNSESSAHSDGKDEVKVDGNDARESEGKEAGDKEQGDDVDSASKGYASEATTPEIIISDNYGTADTVTSNESGYTSTDEGRKEDEDLFEIGSLHEITNLRLLDKCAVSPYRCYHHEILKTQGVRRCMMFMNKIRRNLLFKVFLTLEKPTGVQTETISEEDQDTAEVFDDTKEEDKTEGGEDENAATNRELQRYGCWSEESLAMRLPSYRNHFLLLSTICMEAVHDYLSLRLEDRPENPSCLTIKQLIHDLKEGLDIATEMRAAFVRNIEVALAGHAAGSMGRHDLLLVIRTFDATIETVLKQYLSYLVKMSATEHMSRASLQAEWSFTARLAKRIRCAKLQAPATFAEIACNQLNRIRTQYEDQFQEHFSQVAAIKDSPVPALQVVYAVCRSAQCIYSSERESTLQAAQWARALAAKLSTRSHGHLRAPIFNSLMALRDIVVKHTLMILERSRIPPSENSFDTEAASSRVRELLLQVYKIGFELHKELYRFAQAPFALLQDKGRRRDRPASLQPLRPAPIQLRRKRPETVIIHESFNPALHKELHRFVTERSPAPRRSISHQRRLLRADSIGEDVESSVFDDRLFDGGCGDGQTQTSIELLLSGEQPQPEEVELRSSESSICSEERQWAITVARAVVQFARCWMQFVVERCDTGRGLRPRWASQGLEFLMLACDPCNTKHLTDEEFEELKKEMDGCISHVIGTRPAAARVQDNVVMSPGQTRRRKISGPLSCGAPAPRSVPAPPTPPTEPDPLLAFTPTEPGDHSARVLEAIKQLDSSRDDKLRDMKAVGHVLEAAVASYEPKLRQLKFKWQRGLKIGAGTFGKVYTVVNTESGQLLAMKEISVGAGDRRAMQRAANELRVLEGAAHPHLVRYYGCELHREEMLIFMELCVEGSLEALIATSGALTEHTVRRYTKQLVSAVAELHTRGIAHRDIKSGNIFLTNEGHCLKLGDFGCAVKIRANTTAAGELQGYVGTQAYMAPEVFMKSTGHGRAADVWSLGCVVTEMASGKRPFSEYDSNYQIMFVVGMGGRPTIPETLSDEGQQFCLSCLTHEPELRPKAEALSLHHFLMVKSDEDCNCEPAYLIATPTK